MLSATPSSSTGRLECRLHRVGQYERLGDAVRAWGKGRHERELIARQARQQCLFARRAKIDQRAQTSADLAQHRISGGVAERVVDLLEAIEVEQQHRHRLSSRAVRGQSTAASPSRNRVRLGSPVRPS